MGIPIISEVLGLVDTALDKIFPDAGDKEKAKMAILQQALEEQKLVFGDIENARELYKAELDAQSTPSWARALQVCARPLATYALVGMYVYVKLAPLWGLPAIGLNDSDYYLIGSVFIFLFGARSVEKLRGKA